ncbi:MAG TPA: M3 family metallopeptidase, partial [Coxiellaceae bacterium]|nr:M3 family metallopeptidase [Coxiellaceae bacterium]
MDIKLDNLPQFSQIRASEIKTQLSHILAENKQAIDVLLSSNKIFNWNNLIYPLEELSDRLDQFWSSVQHMHSVCNTPALREAYNECLPLLSDYSTELAHNLDLFRAIESIANGPEYQKLDKAQRRCIDNDIRDFKLAGVALEPAQKERFAELTKQLSQLQTQYEEHVLDATQAWHKHITDEKELSGLSPRLLQAAQEAAKKLNLSGWVFTLEAPSYSAVMNYADNSKLREEIYTAYVTRASELGPHAGKWDNSQVMLHILKAELDSAKLLGFNNYAERSLATKMANTTHEVLDFLKELTIASKPKAELDYQELKKFSTEHLGMDKLNPWDIAYVTEKLRIHDYAISQEDLR